MESGPANVLLVIVSAGALLFTGYLIQDYFSRQARSARRRKKHAAKKLKRTRAQSKFSMS